jgi:hypothetical protein
MKPDLNTVFLQGETFKTSVSLPEGMLKALKFLAERKPYSVSQMVTDIINEALKQMVIDEEFSLDSLVNWVPLEDPKKPSA